MIFEILYQLPLFYPLCNLLGLTLKTLVQIFKIYVKIHDFSIVFSLFWDTLSIANILPSGRCIGTPALKTNYMLNFNNFSSTKPILDLKVSLDRVHQDLKFCLKS